MSLSSSLPGPSPLSFSRLCDDYLCHIRHERGCADTTCFGYASWLRHYQKWCDAEGHGPDDLSRFTPTLLRSYLYHHSRLGKRPRTILSAFNPLKGLGVFLVTHGLLDANPCKAVTLPKKDAARRDTISQAEIVALLQAAERLHPPRRTALGRALLYTLVFTGVRFDELRSLKAADINLDAGTLLVAHGKGEKSRLLYPPAEAVDALTAWLRERDRMKCSHGWLWALDAKRRCGEEGIRDLLEEIKAGAGLRDRDAIKPHSIRHFFATHLMEQGASIKTIQAALGHALATTTMVYLHAAETPARDMQRLASLSLSRPEPAAPPAAVGRGHDTPARFQRQRRVSGARR